ncbi:hypothetical protein ABT297_19020 [Dactylosporangium sp. NPDC000555]|uniref:hypothetical protein n=1 Tax=Dactylosporangium sp. NPDC000555 TaxID=3154260 RepID=UPI003321E452
MSDDYTPFSTDLDGDGVEDQAVIYTLDDGSNVLVGDIDHDGHADIVALDSNGDGVYEQMYDINTGVTTDLTDPGYGSDGYGSADYDGSGGNLDGDISSAEATAGNGTDGGHLDAGTVSDMLAMQHETSMSIINNI